MHLHCIKISIMKKIILFISCCVFIISAKAQVHFNHLAIYVVDLETSSTFYRDVMQLQEIPEPFHDNQHTWFKTGEHNQLHVISGAKEKMPHDVSVHMSFSVPSMETFTKHLDSLHIKYGNSSQTSSAPQVRADGIKQIYLQDPDGYWIEVNDDKF